MAYVIVPIIRTTAAVKAISWWAASIPVTVKIHAVRAFIKEAETVLQALFLIQASRSASTVRQSNVSTTRITGAVQSM